MINGLICFEVNIIVFILLDLLATYHPISSSVGHEAFDTLDIWKHTPIGHWLAKWRNIVSDFSATPYQSSLHVFSIKLWALAPDPRQSRSDPSPSSCLASAPASRTRRTHRGRSPSRRRRWSERKENLVTIKLNLEFPLIYFFPASYLPDIRGCGPSRKSSGTWCIVLILLCWSDGFPLTNRRLLRTAVGLCSMDKTEN